MDALTNTHMQGTSSGTMEIHLHGNSPVLFVDGSYYVFHRYFATLRWYSLRNYGSLTKEEQLQRVQNLHTDESFLDAFFRHLRQDLKKWQKEWAVPHGNIVFGFDCTRCNIWRNAHYAGYKKTRTTAAGFNGQIFPAFYTWFEQNKGLYGLSSVEADGLEADDVIYLSVRRLLELQPGMRVVVLTNDNDYLQIRKLGAIDIVNAQMHSVVQRSSIGSPEQDLLMKVLMGDTSDNIPAVAAKIGPATAKKLALQGRTAVEGWAQQKGCSARLQENERLISFEYIPSDFQSTFDARYEWVMV